MAAQVSVAEQEALRALERARDLPSVPAVALEVLRIARDDEANTEELARVVSLDPALSAKILRIANSALLGRACEIVTLKRACAQLGFKTVKLWALSFAMVDSLERTQSENFDYDEYWRHSVLRAVSAKLFAEATAPRLADEAFITALLSQIGQLVLASCLPEDYKAVRAAFNIGGRSEQQVQQEVLGYSSDDLAVALLRSWGLPTLIHQAVLYACDPSQKAEAPADIRILARSLNLASHCEALLVGSNKVKALTELNEAGKTFFNLEPEQIEEVLAKVDQHMAEMSDILQVKFEERFDSIAVLREAQIEMLRETIFVLRDAVMNERRAAELEVENSILLVKAQSDPLTGLANHRTFQDALASLTSRTDDGYCGPRVGLLMLDIDDFKGVNDTYGHPVGDEVLQAVARILCASTRGEDLAARYGGDEFAVLMPRTSPEGIEKVADRLKIEIAKQSLVTPKGPVSINVSIGAAHVEMFNTPVTPAELIQLADRQLYAVKDALKSGVAREATGESARD